MLRAYITGAIGTVTVLLPCLPETLFLDRYEKKTAKYKDGEYVDIDPDTEELIEKVLTRVNLKPKEEMFLKFYNTKSSNAEHAGSCKLNSFIHPGAIVGLPSTLACKTPEDLEKTAGNEIYGVPIDYTKAGTDILKQNTVLTEQEKAFLIAREIYQVGNNTVVFKVCIRLACLFGGYWSIVRMCGQYTGKDGFTRLNKDRLLGVYAVVGVALFLYYCLRVSYEKYVVKDADRRAAKLSPYYADGGVSYFEKELARNQALRSLLKDVGEKYYSAEGDELSRLKVKSSLRRDNMLKYVEKWKEGKLKMREIKQHPADDFKPKIF